MVGKGRLDQAVGPTKGATVRGIAAVCFSRVVEFIFGPVLVCVV